MDLNALTASLCEKAGWPRSQFPDGKVAVTVPLPEGRRQDVLLGAYEEDGQSLVRLVTSVGSLSRLSGEKTIEALRMNAELRFGAFAFLEGDLVLTDSFLLSDSLAIELDQAIRYIARRADMAERFLFGVDVR